MSETAKPVLIVGGGIGGLAAALALSRKGIPVQVLERAPDFKEIGAGIQLGPNVFRMFEVLGLTETVFHWSVFPEGLLMRDSITGEIVVEMTIDKRFHDKYHAPYGVIHRADLLNVILDACKKSNLIKLATSKKVVAIEDDGSIVTARTESGEIYRGAAMVGCDGLWSTVREKVVGDGKPNVSGHIAYRAVLPISEWPKDYRIPKMVVWCGEKTHLVHYPLRRGELFNLVAVFHSDRYEEGWDSYGDPEELHMRFAEKCQPVRTLLRKVNAWKMWVLCDRPPIKNWSKGRITLLGDAAHPMLQYLAQGGNTAIEDAVCLANQIEASSGDYSLAFKKYQELRYLRTGRVQLMARVFGEVYHASGVNRELRNQVLPEWMAQGGVDMSWLYGEQPELPHVANVPMPDAAHVLDFGCASKVSRRPMPRPAWTKLKTTCCWQPREATRDPDWEEVMSTLVGFGTFAALPEERIGDKISRRILSGDQGMIVWWSIGAGVHVEPHSHANEQIAWMLKGKMEFRLDNEQRVCGQGDVVVIPGGMEHEAWFREDSEVIDFFAPPREDFLLGGKPAYMSEV